MWNVLSRGQMTWYPEADFHPLRLTTIGLVVRHLRFHLLQVGILTLT